MVGEEQLEVREGTALRFDPETFRMPKAGPDGLTMIAIGAPPGSYQLTGRSEAPVAGGSGPHDRGALRGRRFSLPRYPSRTITSRDNVPSELRLWTLT